MPAGVKGFVKGRAPHIASPEEQARYHQTGRDRLAKLPPLIVPSDIPIEEFAVTVGEAAKLAGVGRQSFEKQILMGTLAAYQHAGKRWITLDDLARTEAAQKQAAEVANEEFRIAQHADNVAHPAPDMTDCTGPYEECWSCNPAVQDALDREGNARVKARVGRPGKGIGRIYRARRPGRPYPQSRLDQLAKAREPHNQRRRLEAAARRAVASVETPPAEMAP